ncbi:MAG: D-alanyl-D-alanine endopeptidase [Ramlibacter sp.]
MLSAVSPFAGAAALNLHSLHAIVVDRDTGATLYAKGEQTAAPIASVTKLLTAMVVLDEAPDMDEVLTVTNDDVDTLKHSSSRLPVGSRLSRREMLHVALMSSENRAAHALARYSHSGNMEEFVRAMNAKAKALGMTEAHFVEPTGLSPQNQATAQDLARLVEGAAVYPAIHEFTSQTGEALDVGSAIVPYRNTNHLVGKRGWDVFLSKTGYINEAGRCVVMAFKAAGRNLAVVLMGASSSQSRESDLLKVRRWVSGERDPLVATESRGHQHLFKRRAHTGTHHTAIARTKRRAVRA